MTKEELALYSHPKMQEKFREVMGPLQANDRFRTFYRMQNIEAVVIHSYEDLAHCYSNTFGRFNIIPTETGLILLPLPIDPVNPERGLWGMVDWKRWRAVQDLSDESGLMWLFWMPFEPSNVRIKDRIPLALLKALAHQIGVEVEG